MRLYNAIKKRKYINNESKVHWTKFDILQRRYFVLTVSLRDQNSKIQIVIIMDWLRRQQQDVKESPETHTALPPDEPDECYFDEDVSIDEGMVRDSAPIENTLLTILYRGRYPASGHPMPWVISFFFKWEGNKYFSLYAYCSISKSDLVNPNFVEKNSYFILFFLENYFFDKQSKFLDIRLYWNQKGKHRFIYERELK